ncbi:MAG TPA: formylglycine-generating enzyme family protein [Povalibacter sp.]|uniref:formylglycine-generating enzyme family protein n=1 Tax=Povalibacter sp. TaxID=1962978 RepID=UPI002BFD4DB3|nr:formylglycine-generating enzyme family protein [Povalibacter sp.]HMN46353.1 formylglycine-generating enzyme family protein [Povalibacter sp.]
MRAPLLASILWLFTAASALTNALADAADPQVTIPPGTFESVLPPAPGIKQVDVAPFRMDRTPVTNAQFARFVAKHPEWQRDRVARVFADAEYLGHWKSATSVDPQQADRPVVRVSWFAASAYCEARGARLPTWYEWEYVAAASTIRPDARDDDAWRQKILTWYSKSGRGELPLVGQTPANFYGVRDLHGVVWEWVDDLGSMLVAGDNRQQNEPDALRYCGPGALTMEQKENYATLMRIAMLSSMQARYTSATMGFRCITDSGDSR